MRNIKPQEGEKKMKLKMMSPDDIMIIVVSLIIFSIGVYAFFITLSNIPVDWTTNGHQSGIVNSTHYAIRNASITGNNVFNIVGVVLIVGAIMIIVGIVYSYIRPRGPTY